MTSPEMYKNEQTRIVHLDGFRGLAVLLVLLSHFFGKIYLLNIGWIGSNLFFILSGYLITNRLFYHYTNEIENYYRNFFIRRFLRIFPLYYGCLILFFLVLPTVSKKYNINFIDFSSDQLWYWFYMSNWKMVFFGETNNTIFNHFWSLAAEEQFYLIWPILFIKFQNKNRKILILLILALSVLVRISSISSTRVYFSTLTACEPLLLGSYLSLCNQEKEIAINQKLILFFCISSMILLALVFYRDNNLYVTNHMLIRYGYSAINILWLSLLYFSLLSLRVSFLIKKTFSVKAFVWLGKYSYGIYVFHWIIYQLFIYKIESFVYQIGIDKTSSYLISRLILILIVFILSFLSYHCFEKHFLRLKNRLA